REDVQAEAERGCTEEFKIELAGLRALPVEVGEFEGVHGVATLANPASWSQGSPLFSWTSRSTSPTSSGMRSNSTSGPSIRTRCSRRHSACLLRPFVVTERPPPVNRARCRRLID